MFQTQESLVNLISDTANRYRPNGGLVEVTWTSGKGQMLMYNKNGWMIAAQDLGEYPCEEIQKACQAADIRYVGPGGAISAIRRFAMIKSDSDESFVRTMCNIDQLLANHAGEARDLVLKWAQAAGPGDFLEIGYEVIFATGKGHKVERVQRPVLEYREIE
jgi:hypothetical protein